MNSKLHEIFILVIYMFAINVSLPVHPQLNLIFVPMLLQEIVYFY